jgi:hypothetical protein
MIISLDCPPRLSFSILPVKSNFQVGIVKMKEEKLDWKERVLQRKEFWRDRNFERNKGSRRRRLQQC